MKLKILTSQLLNAFIEKSKDTPFEKLDTKETLYDFKMSFDVKNKLLLG